MKNRDWFTCKVTAAPKPQVKESLFEEEWYKWGIDYISSNHRMLPQWGKEVALGNLQGHIINIFIYFFYQRHVCLNQKTYDKQDLDHFNQYIWNTLRQKDLYKKKITIPVVPKSNSSSVFGIDYIYE